MGKTCFKCGLIKPIEDFYSHKRMADGHLNKCKECTKNDTRNDYRDNPEKHREYEHSRQISPERRARKLEYQRVHRAKNQPQTIARQAVVKAVRAGILVQQPCVDCGAQPPTEGHHEDYMKPLDVVWLCFACHRKRHGQTILTNIQALGDKRVDLVCISDTHCNKIDIPVCDVLIHAGDLTSIGSEDEVVEALNWLDETRTGRIILVPGNHDFLFERQPDLARKLCEERHIELLIDQCATIAGMNVWGTPYQPWFLNWAFNIQDDEELQAKWAMIPDDTDILITHTPPMNMLGELPGGRDIGSQSLYRRLLTLRPMLHVFGHCHNGYGVSTMDLRNGRGSVISGLYVNASICDGGYNPVNAPITIKL